MFSRDQRLDEALILLRDCNIIFPNEGIKHHLWRLFMLPRRTRPIPKLKGTITEGTIIDNLQSTGYEHPVPYMTPRTMTKIMTEPGNLDTVNVAVSDFQLRLIFLKMRNG